MKFLKILKEYNQAIIKENQRLKRVYATLVRESEEDNENLDGEEQEFIEPPAEGNSEEDDTEETADGGNPDGGIAGSSDDEDGEEEGSQENESDNILQSGDEFYDEGGMNEGLKKAGFGAALGGALGALAAGSGILDGVGKDGPAPAPNADQAAALTKATNDLNTANKALTDIKSGNIDRASYGMAGDPEAAFSADLKNATDKVAAA